MSEVLKRRVAYQADYTLALRNTASAREAEFLLKVKSARARWIPEKVPADLERLATRVGIKNIRYIPFPMRGRLIREEDHLAVEIDERLSTLDRRFVLAHEIAHVIIEGGRLGVAASQRVSGQIGGLRSESGYRRLELLCDEAAREILIPLHFLRPLIQSTEPSLKLLMQLAQRSDTRPEVVALQVLRSHEWDCRLFWWRRVNGRWVPVQSVPQKSETDLVWLGLEDAENSIVEKAERQQRLVCGPVTFRDSNIRHQCQKAEALPQGEGNVILMLTFE